MPMVCLLVFCLLIFAVFSAHPQDKAYVAPLNLTAEERALLAGKTLRLGVDSARLPFEFKDEKGIYSGISAGFIEACVKRLGFRKDWPLLDSALDKAPASLSKGEVSAITGRRAVDEYRPEIDWRLTGPFAVAVLVVVIFVFIWNRRLRHSIRERKSIQLELQEHARALESRSSIKSSLAMISGELQKAESYEDLAQKMMFHLAPLVDISYGAFYIMNEKDKALRLAGGFGLMASEEEAGSFAVGEGLVGQCAREKKIIDVTGLQSSPVRITWGGGHLHPQEIILFPVMQIDSVLGVLELASMKHFTDEQRALLADLMPLVAMNMEILQRNMRTRELLEQSRSQTEALAAYQSQLLARQHELEEQKNLLLDKQRELEQSREVLAQEEEKSRMLLDSISVGIIIIDPESRRIVDVNPVASRMIGLAKEDITDQVCHKFICPREQGNCPILDADQKIDYAERVLLTAEGRAIPVIKTVTPIFMSGRKYLVESFVDITEQKAMEETLKKQMEEMERFNRLTITRELKMIELKREINDLLRQMGSSEKYRIVSETDSDQT